MKKAVEAISEWLVVSYDCTLAQNMTQESEGTNEIDS